MRSRSLITASLVLAGLGGAFVGLTAARRSDTVQTVDFDKIVTPTKPAFDARLAPASDANIKAFRIPIKDATMQGMYLPIIVDPKNGWGTKADKEFIIVQSEFYAKRGDTFKVATSSTVTMEPDWLAQQTKRAAYVVFNGRAGQYKDTPLRVDVGDRVRFFVVNAGPNFDSDFHVVGAVFDRVYPDGNPKHALEGVQTYGIPAGGGAVFETVFAKDASGEGLYPFVTHSFADAEKGAVGIIQVGVPRQFATMSH